MVTVVPATPAAGDRLLIAGVGVNGTPLLTWPPTVATTGPAVAPFGTWALISVAPQPVTVALTPLNVTVPVVVPNPWPAMVTELPTSAVAGEMPVIKAPMLNCTELLGVPETFTTTGPLLAL